MLKYWAFDHPIKLSDELTWLCIIPLIISTAERFRISDQCYSIFYCFIFKKLFKLCFMMNAFSKGEHFFDAYSLLSKKSTKTVFFFPKKSNKRVYSDLIF